jgi:type I restriction enzyme S subunit
MTDVLVPPYDVIYAFERSVASLWQRIAVNERESRTLAVVRDALLPKLISGEIRVKDFASVEHHAIREAQPI